MASVGLVRLCSRTRIDCMPDKNLVHAIGGNGRAVTLLATPLILDANNNTGSTFEFTMTTLASNGYWFGDTWISIATHALCSPTSRGIPESALYEFDEHVTQLLGFGNTVSTFSIILYDFETSVAQAESAVVWAGSHYVPSLHEFYR